MLRRAQASDKAKIKNFDLLGSVIDEVLVAEEVLKNGCKVRANFPKVYVTKSISVQILKAWQVGNAKNKIYQRWSVAHSKTAAEFFLRERT